MLDFLYDYWGWIYLGIGFIMTGIAFGYYDSTNSEELPKDESTRNLILLLTFIVLMIFWLPVVIFNNLFKFGKWLKARKENK